MEQLALAAEIALEPGTHPAQRQKTSPRPSARRKWLRRRFARCRPSPRVRRAMVAKQRAIGATHSVVMEGRDIGTVVFPEARRQDLSWTPIPKNASAAASSDNRDQGRQHVRKRTGRADDASATGATARAPMRRWPRRPTPSTWIPRLSRSNRWKRRSCAWCARASPTERISVERSAGHEIRRNQRGFRRAHARGGRYCGRGTPRTRPVAIVVSAMSKITDLLLDTMRHAEAGDRAAMETSHRRAAPRATKKPAAELAARKPTAGGVWQRIDELIAEFERIVNGMRCWANGRRAPWMRPWRSASGSPRCWSAEYLNGRGHAAPRPSTPRQWW